MQPRTLKRLLRALAREGLDVQKEGPVWRVRRPGDPRFAEVLLPPDFRPEAKALRQLADLAGVRHPAGGRVTRAIATPDFHPGGGGVAIGSVVETEGLVIPAALGGDINCGMRLHVVDLPVDAFRANRDALVEALSADFFGGRRDLPLRSSDLRALFHEGLVGWLLSVGEDPRGLVARADLAQLEAELPRVFAEGSLSGHARWAPEKLLPPAGVVRDGTLATIGGGNHFVEFQVVEAVLDRRRAYALGVREGALAFMIHSGSRKVGKAIGGAWRARARAAWPAGVPHPRARLYGLSQALTPGLVDDYLEAEATAANYGFLNRLLLAEVVRARLRERFGPVEAPLVCDLPHNLTLREGDRYVTRKGACPAHAEQPVVIPGSMGTPSYLAVGLGSARSLSSASHGAGRAISRFELSRGGADRDATRLGLACVDCVTPRPERRIEEAPAAYKPIQPVIDAQVAAGASAPVARLAPILTFKG
jgi:tRNA-splicing ligase RtcB